MKYKPELIKEICDNLKIGMKRTYTMDLVGISYETFTEWMRKSEFSECIKKAEMECLKRNIGLIQKAGITTWQAAAWWLERNYPEDYALKSRHEYSGPNGGPIDIGGKVTIDDKDRKMLTGIAEAIVKAKAHIG